MRKKVVVLGGGTGMSFLLKGLKEFPIDITAVVSVCDDGRSTGRLREEFHVPAMGDLRQVLVALSETEPLVEKLLNYKFETTSDLNGHKVGNLLLTAMSNIAGNMSTGVEALVEGEHNITLYDGAIKTVYYKKEPKVNKLVLKAIEEADLIILSMGSIYTSILPNLICKKVLKAIEASKAPIMYTCNMMTQPGETDGLKVSDHIKIINKYLGKRKINVVIANNGKIDKAIMKKYETLEQKDAVIFDKENLKGVEVISNDYVIIEDEKIRHNTILLSVDIFKYLITKID